MNAKLFVEQKITAFANKYVVYGANPDGTKGQVVAFAQQKRMALKEKVTFYSDETKNQAVFSFRAEKVMDIHGRYFVEDSEGRKIGTFRKDFGKSLVNSTWHILDNNDQSRITVAENSIALAIFRRYGGFVPLLGGFVEIFTNVLKYHFNFVDTASGELIGKYRKTTLIRDRYELSMSDESFANEDWRMIAAVAVALDALQSR